MVLLLGRGRREKGEGQSRRNCKPPMVGLESKSLLLILSFSHNSDS